VRISTKFQETRTQWYIYWTPTYRLKELIASKQFEVKVSVMRNPPKDSHWFKSMTGFGYHKVALTQTIAGALLLSFHSGRLMANEVKELGLEPIPDAIEKEHRRILLNKLNQAS
jgi:hypothetical protein